MLATSTKLLQTRRIKVPESIFKLKTNSCLVPKTRFHSSILNTVKSTTTMKMSIDSADVSAETKTEKKNVVRRRPRTRSQSEAEAKQEEVI